MIVLIAVILALQVRDAPAAVRANPAGTGAISGVVSSTERGERRALRSAVVSITGGRLAAPRVVSTDESGRFAFAGLTAGVFSLTVEKPGYLKSYIGSRAPGRPPGALLSLAEGQQVTGLEVDVPRGAAIEGTLRNEFGAPIASGQVSAVRITTTASGRRFSSPRAGMFMTTTDDRGHYRLYGLPPGEYTLRGNGSNGSIGAQRVSPDDVAAADAEVAGTGGAAPLAGGRPAAPRLARSMSYFPDVSDIMTAQSFALTFGDERTGVDLVNQPVPTFAVSVVLVAPHADPLENAQIGIANLSTQSLWTSPGGVVLTSDGRGQAGYLPRGRYLFFGRARDKTGRVYWTETEIDVDGADVVDAALPFRDPQRVIGRVATADGDAVGCGAGRWDLRRARRHRGTVSRSR